MMKIQRDSKDQPFIEWQQAENGFKRAWIQRKPPGTDKDWAGAKDGRYLNVVRVERLGSGPAGNATDFPIFSDLSDEQILIAFVTSVSAVTGCQLEFNVGHEANEGYHARHKAGNRLMDLRRACGIWQERQDLPDYSELRNEWNRF